MKVRITEGTYGYVPDPDKPYIVKPVDAGGICEVSEAEAARIIALGVAEAVEIPASPVATPQIPANGAEPESNTPEEEAGNEPQETPDEATLQEAEVDLSSMKLAELKAFAAEYGIDTGKMRSKAEVIAAITAANDALPDLTPEGPVV